MAIRIEIDKQTLQELIEFKQASIKRALNTSKNPKFAEIYRDEFGKLTLAAQSITEIK